MSKYRVAKVTNNRTGNSYFIIQRQHNFLFFKKWIEIDSFFESNIFFSIEAAQERIDIYETTYKTEAV